MSDYKLTPKITVSVTDFDRAMIVVPNGSAAALRLNRGKRIPPQATVPTELKAGSPVAMLWSGLGLDGQTTVELLTDCSSLDIFDWSIHYKNGYVGPYVNMP